MWFGTNGGGLCKVDNSTNQFGFVKNNRLNSEMPNEPVWTIYKDRSDLLWVGVKGNQNIFYSRDEKSYSKLKIPNLTGSNIRSRKEGVKAMLQDSDGTLWISNNNSLFEAQKTDQGIDFEPIKIKSDIGLGMERLTQISTLYQTLDGIFWIGTQQKGIRKSKEAGNPKNQSFESYLRNERITTFLEDSQGRFWVGTYNGLQLFNPINNEFTSYSKKKDELGSLSSDIVICIFEDKKGSLWVGTPNGLNLAIFDENNTLSFRYFQENQGLPNNYIQTILGDDHGNLWIGTNKGISRFNIEDNSFNNFDVNDGLQSNSFSEGAGFKDKDGKLYFGGINGLNIFHPDSIQDKSLPAVIITGLKISGQQIYPGTAYNDRFVLNKAIEYTDEITLTHRENIFSLEFNTLDFHSSSRYSYRFMLEGIDEDWLSTTLQKNVTYSNLKAGNYNFKS